MKSTEKYQWYPVCTNPRAEKKAFASLQQKGIEAYLPLQRQLKQWSDRKKWVEEPLIKSYLFVKICAAEHTTVLMTSGICRFIYFSGKIASMPERQIENIKLLLANESDLELSMREFKQGEQVMVKAGPLQGLRGELVTVQSQKKLLVRIEHIGQSLLVQVPAAFIEPIDISIALAL
ncbi:UpxY family transcription antiterminator [Rubrolithibacter danxiaensis]|uniref:UpxY family transcription antiterminator n=1 Tax=Rubrolithibacter danxiaensis TaxID=3390805 RepID=UPI003BF7BD02